MYIILHSIYPNTHTCIHVHQSFHTLFSPFLHSNGHHSSLHSYTPSVQSRESDYVRSLHRMCCLVLFLVYRDHGAGGGGEEREGGGRGKKKEKWRGREDITHTNPFTHSLDLLIRTDIGTLTHSLTLSLTHTHTHTLTYTQTLTTHSHTVTTTPPPPPPPHTHTDTHSLRHSHTHPLTLTHRHTLYRCTCTYNVLQYIIRTCTCIYTVPVSVSMIQCIPVHSYTSTYPLPQFDHSQNSPRKNLHLNR